MIDILIMLGVLAIFCVVAWFVLSQMNLPEPIRQIIIIILVIVAGVLAIGFLLNFQGGGNFRLRGDATSYVTYA